MEDRFKGLCNGRVVRWVPGATDGFGSQPKAAIVVGDEYAQSEGVVDLQVFLPGQGQIYYRQRVPYGADKMPGTWHWPEKA